jgi:hypothetical protein
MILDAMKTRMKVAIVLGGYVVAGIVASIVVAHSPNANDPGGMAAFGDLLYFGAVFSAVASVPTGFALWFLRPYRRFWTALATMAVVIAATGVAAAIVYTLTASSKPDVSAWSLWAGLTPLPMLAAPVLAGGFGLAAVLAPARGPKIALFSAAAAEVAVAAYAFIHWFISNRFG